MKNISSIIFVIIVIATSAVLLAQEKNTQTLFAAFARLVEPGTPDAFVTALLEELAAPDRRRAAAGGAWLREHGGFDAAVLPIAEIWEAELIR